MTVDLNKWVKENLGDIENSEQAAEAIQKLIQQQQKPTTIDRECTNEELEQRYWEHMMELRMPLDAEVTRLLNIGIGFYHKHLSFEAKENSKYKEHNDLLSFIERNKRPYGNKSIGMSVAFNLGWYCQCPFDMKWAPEWVIEEGRKVHQAVIAKIKRKMEEHNCTGDNVINHIY